MTSQMKKSPTSPADNVVALYQEHARAFERQRSRDLFERGWLTRFLALLPASGKPRVLDIGCGNGVPIDRHLIEQGCEIMGVDTSLPLLAGAQAAFPDHRWIAADMRRMPLNETFHGLIAWHSLFHLRPEDQRPLFATFARLAAPGAPLMFTSGTTLGEAIGELEGQPLYHGSLDRQEYRDLLEANGFEVVRYVEWDEECGRANVWLARRGGAVEGETRQPRITAVPGEISRG
ncbi:class I SAM-dependent methyltransferase [Achromobacter sp. AONIH1]|uniref:class I SAM-dependent DNA methyltransferase n=1 Tax=Achromobacter sp. AONIH1 TaxID=1758194 RepID=UPI001F302EB8|nr:class I SAM-dependent methyltransferase [Achromobacter sp. AONIH1]